MSTYLRKFKFYLICFCWDSQELPGDFFLCGSKSSNLKNHGLTTCRCSGNSSKFFDLALNSIFASHISLLALSFFLYELDLGLLFICSPFIFQVYCFPPSSFLWHHLNSTRIRLNPLDDLMFIKFLEFFVFDKAKFIDFVAIQLQLAIFLYLQQFY